MPDLHDEVLVGVRDQVVRNLKIGAEVPNRAARFRHDLGNGQMSSARLPEVGQGDVGVGREAVAQVAALDPATKGKNRCAGDQLAWTTFRSFLDFLLCLIESF